MTSIPLLILSAVAAIFATMWLAAMIRRHEAAQRHLAAIRYASTFSNAAAGTALRFLKLYQAGRHDLIAIQFPEFARFAASGDDDA